MKKHYAGIGSRETPKEVLVFFQQLGGYLARKEYILRSGGAKGADKSFEIGCDRAKGRKEIYLPWSGFEGSDSNLIVEDENAFNIVRQFHPYWHNLKQGARRLQARNSHQVLGNDLSTPSDFIICWTKKGKGQGGTGQALRIAKHYSIPIFDCGKYDHSNDIKINLKLFLKENANLNL